MLGIAGQATAQQPTPAAPPPAPDAQIGFQRQVNPSPQDMLSLTDQAIMKMEASRRPILAELEKARAQRDVIKTLCLNDKLNQLDVTTRSARDRQTALQAAVQRNDTELAGHEFTILTVLRQRAEQLTAEANQCIGSEMAFVGATQVTTQIDSNLPSVDNTEFPPTDGTLISGPPACTSCTGTGH